MRPDTSLCQPGCLAEATPVNEEPYLNAYHVSCKREADGHWSETHSSN